MLQDIDGFIYLHKKLKEKNFNVKIIQFLVATLSDKFFRRLHLKLINVIGVHFTIIQTKSMCIDKNRS